MKEGRLNICNALNHNFCCIGKYQVQIGTR
jgi:hypothetical protein